MVRIVELVTQDIFVKMHKPIKGALKGGGKMWCDEASPNLPL